MRAILLLAALLLPFDGCTRTPAEVSPDVTPSPRAAASKRAVDEPEPPLPPFKDGKRALEVVKETLLKRYDATDLAEDDLYRAAARGMLEYAGRPKSRYDELLTPAAVEDLERELGAEVPGIGYHYDWDGERGQVLVRSIVPGSPAEKAGLRAGDVVLRQGGRLIKGMTLAEFKSYGGPAGKPVDLTVLREDQIVKLTITRAMIAFDDVVAARFGDAGYMRIDSFSQKTGNKVRAAADAFARAGVRALVVDLRDNAGGAFDGALGAAGALLPASTPIGFLVARGKEEKLEAKAGAPLDVPLAVLVNDQTAAGAELLAAALAETKHAKLVGVRTRGKWTVQNMDPLPNGYAMKYTSAHLLTAARKSYEAKGIAPDVEVAQKDDLPLAFGVTDPERRLLIDPALKTALEIVR
jgi:carboxyl-terminal processing protease